MAGRDERVAANEARARFENEARGDWFRTHARVLFTCECFREGCDAGISLSREDYEAVRAHPADFAVRPEHVDPAIEDVVARQLGHWVIRKTSPGGRRVAEELDPRSDR